MRYYLLHNGNRIYFEFSLDGLKQAQEYVEKHGLKRRKLYIESK